MLAVAPCSRPARASRARSPRARRSPCSRWPAAPSGSPTGSGPFDVIPGQNSINYAPISRAAAGRRLHHPHPAQPDLPRRHRAAGRRDPPAPRRVAERVAPDATDPGSRAVLRRGRGEDDAPAAEGLRLPAQATDSLVLNHMIHNLTPVPTQVYMTYQIDFAPKGSRGGARHPAGAADLDGRRARHLYPVFNVRKGSGRKGRFTYPDDAQNPYGGGPKRNQWVVDRPGVLVGTAGHLHPGGLAHRPEGCRRGNGADASRCSARTRSTSSPRAPCRGTSR